MLQLIAKFAPVNPKFWRKTIFYHKCSLQESVQTFLFKSIEQNNKLDARKKENGPKYPYTRRPILCLNLPHLFLICKL